MVLAFVYILLAVVVALEVPLAVTLQRRAYADLERETVIEAQNLATLIVNRLSEVSPGPQLPDLGSAAARNLLAELVVDASARIDGRVIVVDEEGILIADSDGPVGPDEEYRTDTRPEIVTALDRVIPATDVRDSATVQEDIVVTAVPLQDEDMLLGAVRVTHLIGQVNDDVRNTFLGLVAIGVAGLVAGLLIAFALAGSFARPLNRLAQAARRFGRGDLSSRAGEVGGAEEFQSLARSFDDMATRVESTVRSQREFVANASHQLRTPLTGMRLRLESAVNAASDPELRRELEAAEREVDRLAGIVDRLLVLARRTEAGQPAEVDVGEVVNRAVDRWEARARESGASLATEGNGGLARGDGGDLDQILDNLIDNAIRYAPGPIRVETGRIDGRVLVAVQDSGPGIPAEEVPRVTERFYRGSGAPRGGSGLGLAIVRELAEKWEGSVEVTAPHDGGTRVEVRLEPAEAPNAEES